MAATQESCGGDEQDPFASQASQREPGEEEAEEVSKSALKAFVIEFISGRDLETTRIRDFLQALREKHGELQPKTMDRARTYMGKAIQMRLQGKEAFTRKHAPPPVQAEADGEGKPTGEAEEEPDVECSADAKQRNATDEGERPDEEQAANMEDAREQADEGRPAGEVEEEPDAECATDANQKLAADEDAEEKKASSDESDSNSESGEASGEEPAEADGERDNAKDGRQGQDEEDGEENQEEKEVAVSDNKINDSQGAKEVDETPQQPPQETPDETTQQPPQETPKEAPPDEQEVMAGQVSHDEPRDSEQHQDAQKDQEKKVDDDADGQRPDDRPEVPEESNDEEREDAGKEHDKRKASSLEAEGKDKKQRLDVEGERPAQADDAGRLSFRGSGGGTLMDMYRGQAESQAAAEAERKKRATAAAVAARLAEIERQRREEEERAAVQSVRKTLKKWVQECFAKEDKRQKLSEKGTLKCFIQAPTSENVKQQVMKLITDYGGKVLIVKGPVPQAPEKSEPCPPADGTVPSEVPERSCAPERATAADTAANIAAETATVDEPKAGEPIASQQGTSGSTSDPAAAGGANGVEGGSSMTAADDSAKDHADKDTPLSEAPAPEAPAAMTVQTQEAGAEVPPAGADHKDAPMANGAGEASTAGGDAGKVGDAVQTLPPDASASAAPPSGLAASKPAPEAIHRDRWLVNFDASAFEAFGEAHPDVIEPSTKAVRKFVESFVAKVEVESMRVKDMYTALENRFGPLRRALLERAKQWAAEAVEKRMQEDQKKGEKKKGPVKRPVEAPDEDENKKARIETQQDVDWAVAVLAPLGFRSTTPDAPSLVRPPAAVVAPILEGLQDLRGKKDFKDLLKKTQIGRAVSSLRRHSDREVAKTARSLVGNWKAACNKKA